MKTERPIVEKPVRSPCVSVCVLDDNDICVGCQRAGQEISNWGKMDNQQRRAILELAGVRAREQGLIS